MRWIQTREERLLTEYVELHKKRIKLEEFVNGIIFDTINVEQKPLLEAQLKSMTTYEQCLKERILLFMKG